jgi:hypothetical protein
MKAIAVLLAGGAAFLIAGTAAGQEKIAIIMPALLGPDAPIGEAVKRECNVQVNVGVQVFQHVSQRLPGTVQIDDAKEATPDRLVLKLTLTSVLGAGGGSWSGSKSMTLRGELLKGPEVVMANTWTRSVKSMRMRGTCDMMNLVAVALGKDVGQWAPAALTMLMMEGSKAASATPAPAAETPAAKDEPKQEQPAKQ